MNDTTLRRFEWSVRALAQPAHTQAQLFPHFVCVADELALEFDEWCRALLESPHGELKNDQIELITLLDQQLSQMSGPENEELWLDEALASSPEWTRVREIASELIRKMGWPDSPPPPERDFYVRGVD
jgi:hypothetical protein